MAIQWRDNMSVDGGVIDADHKSLIRIINKFESQAEDFRNKSDALGLLNALRKYTLIHFEREEELQRRAGYEYREAHHNEHVTLVKTLDALIEEAESADGKYLNTIAKKTAKLLHDWVVDHIINQDLRMKPYVERMKAVQKTMKPLDEAAES